MSIQFFKSLLPPDEQKKVKPLIIPIHKHIWIHNCYMGRPKGAPQSQPLSSYALCKCGKSAIKHYGDKEYTILT